MKGDGDTVADTNEYAIKASNHHIWFTSLKEQLASQRLFNLQKIEDTHNHIAY
jgi:hypothetical protein